MVWERSQTRKKRRGWETERRRDEPALDTNRRKLTEEGDGMIAKVSWEGRRGGRNRDSENMKERRKLGWKQQPEPVERQRENKNWGIPWTRAR